MKKDNITIGNSKFGKGLFTNKEFRQGEVLFTFTGQIIHFADTVSLGEKESYPIQIDQSKYLNPDEPWCFINHSCEPNCGINSKLELVAIKEINLGDEIYFDYSTSMLERHWEMNCMCDALNCRHVIKDFDLLPDEIQNKYLALNIVQPFIKKQINDRHS